MSSAADPDQGWHPTGREQATWRNTGGQALAWLVVSPTADGRFEYVVDRIADGEVRYGHRADRASARAAACLVARLLTAS